jgi:hypothetical protein
MEKLNKMLFNLEEVFEFITHGKVQLMLDKLLSIKNELEDSRLVLIINGRNSDVLNQITEQMVYLDANIRTLQDAILCHETKTFEKRTNKHIVGVINICLN